MLPLISYGLAFVVLIHSTAAETIKLHSEYCQPGECCWPGVYLLKLFGKVLSGDLVLPTDDRYANLSLHNVPNFTKKPGIIVLVKTVRDVRRSIAFARRHNIRITIRSCGHDLNGRSTADGSLQINFLLMNKVKFDFQDPNSPTGESIRIQPGIPWQELYQEVSKQQRLIVGPFQGGLCVSGFTMGGGWGPISRSFGLSSDNLLSFDIVLYSGKEATCTKDYTIFRKYNKYGAVVTRETADTSLFWAVRGGGGGTFGVVTHFIITVHPMPSVLTSVAVMYPSSINGSNQITKDLTHFFLDFIPRLPKEWGGVIVFNVFNSLPPEQKLASPVNIAIFLHSGPKTANSFFIIFELLKFQESTQIFHTVSEHKSLSEFQDRWFPETPDFPYVVSSSLIDVARLKNKNELVNTVTTEAMDTTDAGVAYEYAIIPLGGEIRTGRSPPSAISNAFRNADLALVPFFIILDPRAIHAAIQLSNTLDDKLSTISPGTYVNEPAVNARDWRSRFWGEKYQRLKMIKTRFDPKNVFSCVHCVRSYVRYAYEKRFNCVEPKS